MKSHPELIIFVIKHLINIAQTQINVVPDGRWQDLQQLDPWVFKIQFKFILVSKARITTKKTQF
jgi:hypothetical protein